MKISSLFSMCLAIVLFTAACDDAEKANDVIAKMKGEADLSSLVAAIESAGLTDDLEGAENVTVFAPTNAAIGTNLNDVTGDRLVNILQYHVATSRVVKTNLTGTGDSIAVATLLSGDMLYVTANAGGAIFLNGNTAVTTALRAGISTYKGNASVTKTIEAGNGIIHLVDAVLWPDAELNILEAAAKRYFLSRAAGATALAGLATSSSPLVGADPLTLLAPINPPNAYTPSDAFLLIDSQGIDLTADPTALASTLSAHILPGSQTLAQIGAATSISTSLVIAAGPTYLSLTRVSASPLVLRSMLIPDATPGAANFNVPVVGGDVVTKNGRMHYIGNLILPQPPAAPAKSF